MSRRALTQQQVAAITRLGHHWLAPNLVLQVKPNGARSYLFRYRKDGKEFNYGLGGARDVPYREARERAEELRVAVRKGAHPIAERQAERVEVAVARKPKSASPTFEKMATACIASMEAGWKSDKHAAQWSSTLKTYAYPKLGKKPVDTIAVEDVLAVLKPGWVAKPETFSRLRGRIETVLSYAKALGHRSGDNPASWSGALKHLLPPINRVRTIQPRKAMPYPDVPAFYQEIRAMETQGAVALRFLLLTAARTTEVLGARWDEVDLDERIWTVPAERMKAKKEWRVPLSDEAVALLQSLPRKGPLIFPGARKGQTLSNGTMTKVLRTARPGSDFDVHGFRSSHRDWAAEQTDYPREIAEMALAHEVGSEVERAYRRSDLIERRRALAQDWAGFLTG
ncbi:integrase [Aquamicrobium terrae]